MKTVTKIILSSCFFCYFGGIWIIISRFGLVKIITRYGLAELFDQIPKEFPQIKILYMVLAIYTILYIFVTYLIYKTSNRASNEQEQLQQDATFIKSYAERMQVILAQFERSEIKDTYVRRRLQTLSCQIASLPPTIVKNASIKSEIENIFDRLNSLLSDNCSLDPLSKAIDVAIDEINSIKRRSITVKY